MTRGVPLILAAAVLSGLVLPAISAASGLRLRPRDLAKFGSLYLHGGRWNERQVLPDEWVTESTRRQILRPGPEASGYAYQWASSSRPCRRRQRRDVRHKRSRGLEH